MSEEQPRSFVVEGEKIGISKIISQWVEEADEDKQHKRCFRVKGDDGFTYLLACVEQTGKWYLE